MNAKGIPCRLVTGEERKHEEGWAEKVEAAVKGGEELPDFERYLTSCTVEMVPVNASLDVAVIDEIQMIGDADRGWAWTNALLGVKAKEVHLCGEERTVPLITELCASVGDTLHIHHYERLSPLQMANRSLGGDLSQLRKGDCIVSFSVVGIHALRREIQKRTGRKVAIVYGSLPPETRAQQARLFNDPNNEYDFLVASDAVGMGLNLAIKRMIFESSSKFDGIARGPLSIAAIKQIGGRAGRFRTAAQATDVAATPEALAAARAAAPSIDPKATYVMPRSGDVPDNIGVVTTLEDFDYPVVLNAMRSDPEPLTTAGLFPPTPVLERFASYFPPGTPFSYILTRLHELSQMHRRFHLCGLRDQVWVADLIEPVEGLTVSDRNLVCACPASKSDIKLWRHLMPALARCIATQSGGDLLDIEELPLDVLDENLDFTKESLTELERLHKGLVAYLWLSYRFAGVFRTRNLATHVKGLVEERIEYTLANMNLNDEKRRAMLLKRDKAQREQALRDAAMEQALRDTLLAENAEGGDGESIGGDIDAEEATLQSTGDGIDTYSEIEADAKEVAASPDSFSGGEEDVVFEEPGEVVIDEVDGKTQSTTGRVVEEEDGKGESEKTSAKSATAAQ
jgi:ATP-dependent RNA helicase SUPV3L1/SUV3